jgi:hypothetical protein
MKKFIFLTVFFITNIFSADSIYTQKEITKLTDKFLGKPYVANTLSSYDEDEKLVVNFDAYDCFTFIDTIEALKKSSDLQSFKSELTKVRYKDSKISYKNRRHFFSDWLESDRVVDITCSLGACEKKKKFLNKDYKYLKDIKPKAVEISYIKPQDINTSKLKSGDYVGIYTEIDGLDVTHTGIIIKKDKKTYIRHASSKKKRVVDSDFFKYTKNKTGVVVYRPR